MITKLNCWWVLFLPFIEMVVCTKILLNIYIPMKIYIFERYIYLNSACLHAKTLSRVRLFATLWTNLPGFSVHGILQARILEWIAMPSSRGSSPPRDQTHVSYISFITTSTTWKGFFNSNIIVKIEMFSTGTASTTPTPAGLTVAVDP